MNSWSYNRKVKKKKRKKNVFSYDNSEILTVPGHKPVCVCMCSCLCVCASSHAVGSSVCSTLVRLATGLQLLSVSLCLFAAVLWPTNWKNQHPTNKCSTFILTSLFVCLPPHPPVPATHPLGMSPSSFRMSEAARSGTQLEIIITWFRRFVTVCWFIQNPDVMWSEFKYLQLKLCITK